MLDLLYPMQSSCTRLFKLKEPTALCSAKSHHSSIFKPPALSQSGITPKSHWLSDI